MNKYKVISGQNLYDVALTLYGSIEGVFDLLACNSNLSFDTSLTKGMVLNYHEDFVINQDIVSWFDTNRVKVKNGKYKSNDVDVYSTIVNWIDSQNESISTSYKTGVFTQVEVADGSHLQSYSWDAEDTPAVASTLNITTSSSIKNTTLTPFTSLNKWNNQSVTLSNKVSSSNTLDFASSLSGIKFNKLTQSDLVANLDVMFSKGMIVLPSDEEEKQAYYDDVAKPKILIRQIGKSINIGVQISSNSFMAIDWGDDTALDFHHYQKATENITHTYSDTAEHAIIIYGDCKFTNLDLTKVNGVYCAISEVYIYNDMVSPYPSASSQNRLFIINKKS